MAGTVIDPCWCVSHMETWPFHTNDLDLNIKCVVAAQNVDNDWYVSYGLCCYVLMISIECEIRYFAHVPDAKYVNETLVRHGYLGASPEHPSLAFAFSTFDIYRQLHRTCPRLSIESFTRALNNLHRVRIKSTSNVINWCIWSGSSAVKLSGAI